MKLIENDMIQKASELLLHLRPWMIEQQRVLKSMKPAAILSAPLSDQITKSKVRTIVIARCNYKCDWFCENRP